MVYTSIYPRLHQFSSSNKDACTKIHSMICGQISSETLLEPRTSEIQTEISDYTDKSDDSDHDQDSHFLKQNVIRHEKRSKQKVSLLQKSVRYLKRINKKQAEKIANLSAALEDTRCLVHEMNTLISALKREIHSLQQMTEVMELELINLCEFTNEEQIQHESDIAELEEKVKQLQDKCESNQLVTTFSSRTYTTQIRALLLIA